MITIWKKLIQPYLIHIACNSKRIIKYRKKIIFDAKGIVLEIGFGSGLNLPFYDKKKVKKIISLEPSIEMQNIAKDKIQKNNIKIELLTSRAESIPLKNNSIDTVVCTYTLCSIRDTQLALNEIKRVLKKNGELLIIEHVLSPEPNINLLQKILNPIWKIFAGGCHLTCDTKNELESMGFKTELIKEKYIENIPKFIGYNIMGKIIKE